ncbi:MAG: pyridoxal phosphate-dependent aminotransferase [Thermoflexales bacterium]
MTGTGGFLAGSDLSPNSLERARLRLEGRYIDLTSSNPTRNGQLFPADILAAAAAGYWPNRRYTPDPRGHLPAREAIAAYYVSRSAKSCLSATSTFLAASTSEAYSLLFTLLAAPGDNLLAPRVSYPLFELLADMRGIALRPYDLIESSGWAIDEDSLLDQVDARTRGILIVAPHNPTGMIVERALPALTQLGLPVICDEVFAEFAYAKGRAPVFSALHPELPVFVLNGISKMFALPDLKLGWIGLNPAAEAIYGQRLEVLNDTFLGASGLIQSMVPALFGQGLAFTEAMTAAVRDNLDFALEALSESPRLRARAPAGGYYLFPSVFGCNDEEALVLDLLEAGVLVHPGYFYGADAGCHLMISCLTERSVLAEGLDRLVRALK